MTRNTESTRIIGELMLFLSGILWILFVANFRSRMYYGGPDMRFLVWPAIYSTATGIGLATLRRWGAILSASACLFLGAGLLRIASTTESAFLWMLEGSIYAGVAFLIGVVPLRHWRELK
jgi:hypothetical protein